MTSGIRCSTLLFSALAMSAAAGHGAEASQALPPMWPAEPTGSAGLEGATAGPRAHDPAAGANPPVQVAADSRRYRDGNFTGPVTDAYYGPIQVRVTVQGGRLVSIDVPQYPADRRTSRAINSHALPELQSEVIRAQSAHVDIVSGATLTSRAYIRSLNAALGPAGG